MFLLPYKVRWTDSGIRTWTSLRVIIQPITCGNLVIFKIKEKQLFNSSIKIIIFHVGTILKRKDYTKSSSFSSGFGPTDLHYFSGARTFNIVISEPIVLRTTSIVHWSTETKCRVIGITHILALSRTCWWTS